MAKPSKAKVTRITASDTKNAKPTKKLNKSASKTMVSKSKTAVSVNQSTVTNPATGPKAEKSSKAALTTGTTSKSSKNLLKAFWIYVKGAWYELQQVRWPDRASTWSMTGALLAFTAFFLLVIVLLDAAFKYLFQVILGA